MCGRFLSTWNSAWRSAHLSESAKHLKLRAGAPEGGRDLGGRFTTTRDPQGAGFATGCGFL